MKWLVLLSNVLPLDREIYRALFGILGFFVNIPQCLIVAFHSMRSEKPAIAVEFLDKSDGRGIMVAFEVEIVPSNLFP